MPPFQEVGTEVRIRRGSREKALKKGIEVKRGPSRDKDAVAFPDLLLDGLLCLSMETHGVVGLGDRDVVDHAEVFSDRLGRLVGADLQFPIEFAGIHHHDVEARDFFQKLQ